MSALYIYYRVQSPAPAPLGAAIHAMQARLRGRMPGLAASLHRRVDDATRVPSAEAPVGETWMEVYQFNGHADERAWARVEEALAAEVGLLPAGIDGLRHLERFEAISALPASPLSPKG